MMQELLVSFDSISQFPREELVVCDEHAERVSHPRKQISINSLIFPLVGANDMEHKHTPNQADHSSQMVEAETWEDQESLDEEDAFRVRSRSSNLPKYPAPCNRERKRAGKQGATFYEEKKQEESRLRLLFVLDDGTFEKEAIVEAPVTVAQLCKSGTKVLGTQKHVRRVFDSNKNEIKKITETTFASSRKIFCTFGNDLRATPF
ncbi:hypothetical protein BLNAU_22022 [Blattamonas nauphoetae]|uniref:Uncharacterized protein n=1 Tax=Blattamonas nauphoetae TaxID=2049346 RepID=A0ABQ9WUN9_9EUKA|nr:hypothetical protein BLNAU_22022 [Blattamonas nauphoetae]